MPNNFGYQQDRIAGTGCGIQSLCSKAFLPTTIDNNDPPSGMILLYGNMNFISSESKSSEWNDSLVVDENTKVT